MSYELMKDSAHLVGTKVKDKDIGGGGSLV